MRFHRDKRFPLNVLNEDGDCVACCGGYVSSKEDPEEAYKERCFNTRLFVKAPGMLDILRRLQCVGLATDEIDSIISYIETEDAF